MNRSSTAPAALLLSLTALAGSPFVLAEETRATFGLHIANDGMVSSDDGHYSSGVRLEYAFSPDAEHWTARLGESLPGGLFSRTERAQYRLTHDIYTPDDIEAAELIEDDRPYAGLVYGGVSLFARDATERGHTATDLHLDVGMVGPSSGADSIQREVHRLVDSDRPRGWEHQLNDEAIVNLAWRRQWWAELPLGDKQLAFGPSTAAALGNLHTHASAGYRLRFGDAARSVPTLSPSPASSTEFISPSGFNWYLFAGVEGYYVAHNLLLDGNTFSSSHSVDRKEWVGDVSAGFALGLDEWQMRFAAVQRSREFDGQESPDRFAALTFSTAL